MSTKQWVVCALAAAAAGGIGRPALGQVTGYEWLNNWDSLPASKLDFTAQLASSYDRTGGNNDFNQYQSLAGDGTATILNVSGPGVLTRYWMPHATANASLPFDVYVDGNHLISTNTNNYLAPGTGNPLASTLVGGQVSYEPIVFGQSLQIVSHNYDDTAGWAKSHHYYQANYYTLPAGTAVAPTTATPTPQQQAARATAAQVLSNPGVNPGSSGATALLTTGQSIGAGQSVRLGDLSGSGTVRALRLKMNGANDAALDGLRLRISYGDETGTAVDVPVAQFFGAGHGRAAYRSLPLGTDSPDGFYSYWPMPFRQGARVELYNSSAQAVSIDGASLHYDAGAVAADAGYLHAMYHDPAPVVGDRYEVLHITGSGHYVGNLLSLSATSSWPLEADDIITVDGVRTLHGTGFEDAYSGGYYFNHVCLQSDDGDVLNPQSGTGALSGLLRLDSGNPFYGTFTHSDQYRWMLADAVPFHDSLDVRIENYGATAMGSTAFYYSLVPEPGGLLVLAAIVPLLGGRRRGRC